MAYVKEEGIYRCRLQLDPETNHPCIDTEENFVWDAANKCYDKNKPCGGMKIVLRADAYRILENGELSTVCEELSLENRGIIIITSRDYGEEVKHDIVANFVRIFGLRDAGELLTIASVDPEQLSSAEFDVRVWKNTKDGKVYTNYWFAPVGEAGPKVRSFVSPVRNKATLDRLRAKVRVECKNIKCDTANANEVSLPKREKSSVVAPPAGLPHRASEEPALDLNKVWSMWISAHPADTQGNDFYAAVSKMFGAKRDASTLNGYELSAFCKAYLSNTEMVYDDDDMPAF